ncbi:unnamed protein product [Danaus chrysippus]|uniref:(African queen) hypothetical protein n=1 Tax=Danaus chrysippus TaxID=151541 RepID=A0A8J2RB38_9NEOP|nr:unnamed protein product [Danaus chrysippus]
MNAWSGNNSDAMGPTVTHVKQKRSKPIRICESKQCLRSAANLALSMDKSVDPCNDFYQYVCGNWPKEHPRPDAYSSYDWFNDKQMKVFATIRDFLSKNVTNEPKPVKQAKDIYSACMDTEELDKRGLKPVIKILESLGLPAYPTVINVTDDIDYSDYKFNWLEAVIKIKTQLGMDVLIGFDIFTDPKNSSIYRLVMGSPETTNPFPSFLIEKKRHVGRKSILARKKEKHKNTPFIIGDKYKKKNVDNNNDDEEKIAHIYKLFYAEMMKLFVLEATAKNFSLTEVELDQNIFLTANEYYNMNEDMYDLEDDVNVTTSDDEIYINIPEYTVEEIQEHTDMIVQDNDGIKMDIWKEYLEGIFKISNVELDFKKDLILVSDPDLKYMSLMAAYISKASPVSIELFIWIKVVEVMAVHTTSELRLLFQRSYDALRSRELSITPRSLQCASAVNDMMGMAVSYAIADAHFFSDTKPKIEVMLYEMKNALARLVGKAKWMDDNTKLATYQKIIDMKSFVGFPDWLLQVDSLEKYYDGIEVNPKTHLENMINIIQVKIRKALNKFRTGNEFAWATDPTEVNAYHTFQENTISRRFDKNGNLLPWWSNDTIESFVNMTQCFVDQYSNFYVPELGEHVDGKKTLGENIADNGGVRESFGALREHLRKYGPEPKLPGFEEFSPEQLFFISYGNLWCEVSTKDSLKSGLSDEHSPQHFRARGALQNNADFSRIWKCPPDSPMNPRKRCIIY